jgi:glycosyltransferase involved in cell wall biosynthesis
LAARTLPSSSRLHVTQIGRALENDWAVRARAEMKRNPRYLWVGEWPHFRTRRFLAQSHLLVISSRMEGSSNVLSEALSSDVPVIASEIPGLMGTLGKNYPGLFPCGDTEALAELLRRSATDRRFYRSLESRCRSLSELVSPRREIVAWRRLLTGLS